MFVFSGMVMWWELNRVNMFSVMMMSVIIVLGMVMCVVFEVGWVLGLCWCVSLMLFLELFIELFD